MNKFFTTLLAAACAAGLSAGELKIVKAAYGNGEQVNDVTEAFLKHAGGLPGTFLTITPSNKFFAPDPAPRKAKTLTVTYTDGGAEKSVRIPERQFGVVVANADPAQEFKVLRAFYGSGREWKGDGQNSACHREQYHPRDQQHDPRPRSGSAQKERTARHLHAGQSGAFSADPGEDRLFG